jgi:hypothetical protein
LQLRQLFPGAARVPDDARQALAGKVEYYDELADQIGRMHRSGYSIGAIASKVCGGPMLIEAVTLGHFSRRNLVRSVVRGLG